MDGKTEFTECSGVSPLTDEKTLSLLCEPEIINL
jgi:hypothetical protein